MSDAVDSMQRLSEELHAKLMGIPDYRAKMALDRAISEARGDLGLLEGPGRLTSFAERLAGIHVGRPIINPRPPQYYGGGDAIPAGRMSQADAAWSVLRQTKRPMTTSELIEPVREAGATLGGDDPATNLSSSLSREKDRFQSVRWSRKTCWWFKDQPLPPEEANENSFDAIVFTMKEAALSVLRASPYPVSLAALHERVRALMPGVHFSTESLEGFIQQDRRFTLMPTGWTTTPTAPADADQDSARHGAGQRKGETS